MNFNYMGFTDILNILGFYPERQFDSRRWKSVPRDRRYYIKSVLRNQSYIGKSRAEIEELFGINESSNGFISRCSYYIHTKGKKKYYLAFYYNDDQLEDIRYEYKMLV